MRFAVVAPVKNRAWILPNYLNCLEWVAMDHQVSFHFIDDGSTDDSVKLLSSWMQTHPGTLTTLEPTDEHNTSSRDARNRLACYRRLAQLRNDLILEALAAGADWLVSIDTDVLVAPWCVSQLIGHNLPYCAALIDNTQTITPAVACARTWPQSYYNAMTHFEGAWLPMRQPIRNQVLEADLTGAVYVASSAVLRSGALFAAHPAGEDVGYALSLQCHGHTMAVDTGCHAVHCLHQRDLAQALDTFTALCRHGAR